MEISQKKESKKKRHRTWTKILENANIEEERDAEKLHTCMMMHH